MYLAGLYSRPYVAQEMNIYLSAPKSYPNVLRDFATEDMNIYIAGIGAGNNPVWRENTDQPEKMEEIFPLERRIFILESFYYVQDWMIPYIGKYWNFLLDSGRNFRQSCRFIEIGADRGLFRKKIANSGTIDESNCRSTRNQSRTGWNRCCDPRKTFLYGLPWRDEIERRNGNIGFSRKPSARSRSSGGIPEFNQVRSNFMADVKNPSLTVLVLLGSLAVHVEEYLSPDGNPVDRNAIETILLNPELKEYLEAMNKMALLPVKRK